MCGRLLRLLCLLQVTLVWSLPMLTGTEQPTNPQGFKLETNAQNCIEPNAQETVTLPCTYTGEDYEFMTVMWYRASRQTGCCAKSVTDYKYWKLPVTLRTLLNHTAQSVTVQLIINQFNSSFSGLYFCQAYNPLYPTNPLRLEHITELTLPGSPLSPFLDNCNGQYSPKCAAPVPDVEPNTLCVGNGQPSLICKPYSLQTIKFLKYNSNFESGTFQLQWTKPAIPCAGYSWRARMCQSDALITQAGFTQSSDSDNHTATMKCSAPWNNFFQPTRMYWSFKNLKKNTNYILQAERVSENKSERTVFTSPSIFVGYYKSPSIEHCLRTVTTSRGQPVTLRCVVTGNPRPKVAFLQSLQPVANTGPLHAGDKASQSQSEGFNWVHNEIHGPWVHNLTISPVQNGTYACIATNSINTGWGIMKEQKTSWIDVIVNEDE